MGAALDLSDVDAERRADVALDHAVASRRQWEREHRRPRSLSSRDALLALQFEALLVWTAAANLINGVTLSDEDFERLSIAKRRIDEITKEALG